MEPTSNISHIASHAESLVTSAESGTNDVKRDDFEIAPSDSISRVGMSQIEPDASKSSSYNSIDKKNLTLHSQNVTRNSHTTVVYGDGSAGGDLHKAPRIHGDYITGTHNKNAHSAKSSLERSKKKEKETGGFQRALSSTSERSQASHVRSADPTIASAIYSIETVMNQFDEHVATLLRLDQFAYEDPQMRGALFEEMSVNESRSSSAQENLAMPGAFIEDNLVSPSPEVADAAGLREGSVAASRSSSLNTEYLSTAKSSKSIIAKFRSHVDKMPKEDQDRFKQLILKKLRRIQNERKEQNIGHITTAATQSGIATLVFAVSMINRTYKLKAAAGEAVQAILDDVVLGSRLEKSGSSAIEAVVDAYNTITSFRRFANAIHHIEAGSGKVEVRMPQAEIPEEIPTSDQILQSSRASLRYRLQSNLPLPDDEEAQRLP